MHICTHSQSDSTRVQWDMKQQICIEILPDGTMNEYNQKTNTTSKKQKDGSQTITFPDGCIIETFPDGRKLQKNADGCSIETFPKGMCTS